MALGMTAFAAFGGFLREQYSFTGSMPGWLAIFGDGPPGLEGIPTLSSGRDSLITSILSAGTFCGALLAYPVGDWAGRRYGICLYLILFCIGGQQQIHSGRSQADYIHIHSRFADWRKWIRGAVVSGYQWMITIGLLIASVIVNATSDRPNASCFQIPIGLQFIWAAILATGLILLPESPRNTEFAEIAANLHHERAIGATSYLDCFKNGPGRNGLRMWTGTGAQFFKNSGIKSPFLIAIATNGMWAVDKFGRRFLLLTGAVGMATAQLIVAIVGDVISKTNVAGQQVLIAFVCIFIAFFAATWGPMAWVVTGEIYPTSTRAKAMSMSTASNWLLNFAIGYSTPYLVDSGPGKAGLASNVFYIWGGFCVLCFIFVFFCVPETMGLSLEQVDLLYRNSSILKSNEFRKKILAENMHDEDTEAYSQPKAAGAVQHNEKATRDLSEQQTEST
ncbi:hypothetical protein RQP46_001399 [Phenoliferia psychrophenolica]